MLISAIVMVKNEEEYIGYSIMSMYKYVDEILVVDGGSTDGTVEIINEIIAKYDLDKKIVFWEDLRPKKELIHVRTDMVKKCKGEWILRLEGDEVYSDFNAKQVRNFVKKKLRNSNVKSIGWPYHFFVDNLKTKVPVGEPHTFATIMIKNEEGIHAEHHYRDGKSETFYDEGWFDKDRKEVSIWHPYDNRILVSRNIAIHHYAFFKSTTRHNEYAEKCLKESFEKSHPQVFKRYDFKPLMKSERSREIIREIESNVENEKDGLSIKEILRNNILDLKDNLKRRLKYYKGEKI
ncbi:glycosyltransferase involved in cell wall biosynthesis [Hypnocyclicus thermotrophus]|uniref:Glycosyltransferase involved in cell wall biosynthesis n=1 Tax=Hypnocyclicus thermotrophus TaxID=1627895 RepID=A0AA46DX75_9FUSO|nr:glycosyltransferase family 2 protein [Hypnocyclicus thermotrophus]TDT67872.1 glycosyltransferase involved in cell wall biosynthesis [Hypnocyclicus thermotrophus]